MIGWVSNTAHYQIKGNLRISNLHSSEINFVTKPVSWSRVWGFKSPEASQPSATKTLFSDNSLPHTPGHDHEAMIVQRIMIRVIVADSHITLLILAIIVRTDDDRDDDHDNSPKR